MSHDIAILGDPANSVSALTIDNTANDGIYKLVQRTVILLFTDKSDTKNLGLGTDLPRLLDSNVVDEETIRGYFNLALADVKDNILAAQALDAPDDEKLRDYQLRVEVTERDEVTVDITVVSEAGELFEVRVPESAINLE